MWSDSITALNLSIQLLEFISKNIFTTEAAIFDWVLCSETTASLVLYCNCLTLTARFLIFGLNKNSNPFRAQQQCAWVIFEQQPNSHNIDSQQTLTKWAAGRGPGMGGAHTDIWAGNKSLQRKTWWGAREGLSTITNKNEVYNMKNNLRLQNWRRLKLKVY